MNCDIVKDLIPLYIDGCCSRESEIAVEEHMRSCDECKKLYENMKAPSDVTVFSKVPKKFTRLNEWKASLLQSLLLFLSFALITAGVALEAGTPSGIMNGFWALNLVIPATGFMLSLANWYFVRVYKSKKIFTGGSLAATAVLTLCAYIWAGFHYGIWFVNIFEGWKAILYFNGIGILLTVISLALSKILSGIYAEMVGKE